MRRGEARLAALVDHAAGSRLDGACNDLGQRRFARAVLADKRVDLALAQVEIQVLHRRHAAIGLGDLLHAEDGARSCELRREHRMAALRGDEEPPVELDRGRRAVPVAVGAAVQARERGKVRRRAGRQGRRSGSAPRPCGRPWCGCRRIAAVRGSSGPEESAGAIQNSRGTSAIMSCAVMRLLQHELDQPVAGREDRQPSPAVGGGRQARGIARKLFETGSTLPPPNRTRRRRQLSLTIAPPATGRSP